MIQTVFKRLAPAAALAGAALLGGCDGLNIQFGDREGVPLAELDMTGAAPTELVLAGPDSVIVTRGDALEIDVSGDQEAVDALRFALDENMLAIHREKDSWSDKGVATVRVTMPEPREITLAGSGSIQAERMEPRSSVTVAGSGSVILAEVGPERFDATIAGSGDLEVSGTVERLELTIAGSGEARMAGLNAGRAEVTVAGSGDAEFSSDGTVEASIAGSGDITVRGSATCSASKVGSGSLTCRGRSDRSEAPSAPEPPAIPQAPDAPQAPGDT